MKVVTAQQIQNLDRRTIREFGIPGIVLMENAGRGTVDAVYKYFSEDSLQRIVIFAGSGNNGGDGFVIGRHLINRGVETEVFLLTKKEKLKGDARTNMELYQKLRPIYELQSKKDLTKFKTKIIHADLIVDAILGTGLNSEVKGFYREVIDYINTLAIPVAAVDIPSGINADTGKILGTAVQADLTATFGLPKIGLLIYPGADAAGNLDVVDISIPEYLVQEENIHTELLEEEEMCSLLQPRGADTHKGHYGHLLVVAGSVGKTGAAAMTAEAGLRVGAGLVTLGIPESLNPIMEMKLTEVMTEPLPETSFQSFSKKALPKIENLLEGKNALALGPGISTHPETVEVVHWIVRNCQVPLIIDADGINALAEKPNLLKKSKAPLLLTPHPGEMARLVKTSTKELQGDRVGAAKNFAQKNGVYLALKGARTIIAEPNGNVYINPTGNPGMASGGSGDVLTGMIAGLAAQGYTLSEAVRLGVFLHGYSADLAGEEIGEISLTAVDILNSIPSTLQEVMFPHGV